MIREIRGLGPAAEGFVEPLLPSRGDGGLRSFDASRGNKHSTLAREAALVLPDSRRLASGSGSLPQRERLVVVDDPSAPALGSRSCGAERGALHLAPRAHLASRGALRTRSLPCWISSTWIGRSPK